MSKFNVRDTRAAGKSSIVSRASSTGRTYEGAPGFDRDTKSELFLLAVMNFVGEDTFYEGKNERDERFRELAGTVAIADLDWFTRFVAWLRNDANMRSASLVAAAEGVRARLAEKLHGGNRELIREVLVRADEPGEMLAYWTSRYGRNIPQSVKRGVADAVRRLYTERNLLKYDTASKGFRFADVIELTHPSVGSATWRQGDLFKFALDRRHDSGAPVPPSLFVIQENKWLRDQSTQHPKVMLNSDNLRNAGMTWEDALSLVGSKVNKKDLWEALIPSMGYMALLRNLRNFDEAGVSDEVAGTVAKRLADPVQAVKSRQFPMRFLSAYKAAPSLRWGVALEKALNLSLSNVPFLNGRTLILVDTSGSMDWGFSSKTQLKFSEAATLFGLALAQRCEDPTVVSFSGSTMTFPVRPGESLLKALDRWQSSGFFQNGGTYTEGAVRSSFKNHDRIVVLTDEQTHFHEYGDVFHSVPDTVFCYTWNLVGYRHGHAPSGTGTRHTFGGLTDAGFRMIDLIERGRNADWPF